MHSSNSQTLTDIDALIAEFAPLRKRLAAMLRVIEKDDPIDSRAAGARVCAAELGLRLEHVRTRLVKQSTRAVGATGCNPT